MPPIRETVPFRSVPAFALALVLAAAGAHAQDAAAPKDDPLAAAKPRLQKALATMTDLPSCAFTAKWGPAPKRGAAAGAADPAMPPGMAMAFGGTATGEAQGRWADDLFHCAFGVSGELLQRGRRTIARDDTLPWCVRSGKFADGNPVSFVPDAQLLFDLLRRWDLAVVHREVGTFADRPVETLTVTLNQDQVAEVFWSGALPTSSILGGAVMFRAAMAVAVGGGARAAAAKPDATVDLVFAIDPATGLVHEVRARSTTKEGAGAGAGGVIMVRGGAGGFRVDGDGEEEPDEAAEPKPGAEPAFENGLPVRPRKKMVVQDYTLGFREHGAAKPPELDETAKALLGK